MRDVVITRNYLAAHEASLDRDDSRGAWLPLKLTALNSRGRLHMKRRECETALAAFFAEYEGEIAEFGVCDLLFHDWLGRRLGVDLVRAIERAEWVEL